jgi:competence protein ComEA
MADPPPEGRSPSRRVALFLRRADQPTIVLILCGSWLMIGWFVVQLGRTQQGIIDIDDRAPRPTQFQVDLNTAPWPEFANLPGVGEVLGRTIVDYRQQHGAFQSVEDIKQVPGIGDVRFIQIRPYLVISDGLD